MTDQHKTEFEQHLVNRFRRMGSVVESYTVASFAVALVAVAEAFVVASSAASSAVVEQGCTYYSDASWHHIPRMDWNMSNP